MDGKFYVYGQLVVKVSLSHRSILHFGAFVGCYTWLYDLEHGGDPYFKLSFLLREGKLAMTLVCTICPSLPLMYYRTDDSETRLMGLGVIGGDLKVKRWFVIMITWRELLLLWVASAFTRAVGMVVAI